MTLDLSSLSRQIKQMRDDLRANATEVEDRLQRAAEVLRSRNPDLETLQEKIEKSKTYWPVARPLEPLDTRYPLPDRLEKYTVIATDGSQIEPDRHRAALCYVLNVGIVLLHYGPTPKAILQSNPNLAFKADDLHIVSNKRPKRRFPVQGNILAVKRTIAEADALASQVEQFESDAPVVGLQDGTLIMQTLEGWGIEEELQEMLTAQFLECLERLRKLNVPLASYISKPRASEVTNALRVAECPHPVAKCSQFCRDIPAADSEPCAWLASITDRLLFELLPLADGERSGRFLSPSHISRERYGEHRVHYFYLNVGPEIARVEIPEWVANDPERTALVHATVYDQCQRGDGYPRSLAEAHEKAVVSGADREVFWRLMESMLVGEHLPTKTSQKERSKRIRGL